MSAFSPKYASSFYSQLKYQPHLSAVIIYIAIFVSLLNVNINGHIMCRIDNNWSFTIADIGAKAREMKSNMSEYWEM